MLNATPVNKTKWTKLKIDNNTNDKNQQKNSKQNKENHTPVNPEQDDEYDPGDYLIYLENILRNVND